VVAAVGPQERVVVAVVSPDPGCLLGRRARRALRPQWGRGDGSARSGDTATRWPASEMRSVSSVTRARPTARGRPRPRRDRPPDRDNARRGGPVGDHRQLGWEILGVEARAEVDRQRESVRGAIPALTIRPCRRPRSRRPHRLLAPRLRPRARRASPRKAGHRARRSGRRRSPARGAHRAIQQLGADSARPSTIRAPAFAAARAEGPRPPRRRPPRGALRGAR